MALKDDSKRHLFFFFFFGSKECLHYCLFGVPDMKLFAQKSSFFYAKQKWK